MSNHEMDEPRQQETMRGLTHRSQEHKSDPVIDIDSITQAHADLQPHTMDQTWLVSKVQAAGGGSGVMVWEMFSQVPFISIISHVTASLSVAVHGHSSPSSNVYLQLHNAPCHEVKVTSTWFHEHDEELGELQWPADYKDRLY